ncbi:MAG: hypothetical protein V3U74_05600 [Thermodesulfobacteriota bacterium]
MAVETKRIDVVLGPLVLALTPDNSKLYVPNSNSSTVTVIDTSLDQTTATVVVGNGPAEVAVVPGGSKVYVSNFRNPDFPGSILVYERTADGKAAPVRIIDSQELLGPIDIHVDIVAGEIFVTDVEAVLVFDILSDGLVLPLRLLFGPDTGLSFPVGLFVADFGAE